VPGNRGERAERDAGAGQQDRRRQRQPPGQPLNQADENQESGENEERDRQKVTWSATVRLL